MTSRFLKSALAATLAVTLAACPGGGDDVLGPQIELTETQSEDMIDALEAIGSFEGELRVASAAFRNPDVALFTMPIDETEACPNGGTTRVQGSYSGADDFSSSSANITQTFTSCAAASSTGTVWTFNGAPNMKLLMNGTYNMTTGAYSANGTMSGALSVSSNVGSGSCSINLTITESGSDSGYSGSITGTVCGKSYSETFNETY